MNRMSSPIESETSLERLAIFIVQYVAKNRIGLDYFQSIANLQSVLYLISRGHWATCHVKEVESKSAEPMKDA